MKITAATCFVSAFLARQASAFVPSNNVPLAARSKAAAPLRMAEGGSSVSGPPYSGPASKPILDSIDSPDNMNDLSISELKQLSHELRWEVLESVSKTGGHLSSSLGVVELTVALHHVFDMPEDDIVWDVSHQCYPHKMLTGRRHRFSGLRKLNGLSGFCKRKESEYDSFGAGHSTTSISAVQGMSIGKSMLNKRRNNCIAVIGDGAITGGMAYEAMNSAGYLKNRMIVVLNDNGQVSLPTGTQTAGGVIPASQLSAYTSNLLVSKPFQDFRDFAKSFNKLLPGNIQDVNKRVDEYARGIVSGGTLFEELGFYYVGPLDGHDLDNLVPILEKLRDSPSNKPVLLHIKTNKGQGYPPAEQASDKMHGVGKFDLGTGVQVKGKSVAPSLTSIFANSLIDQATEDRTIVGITAAMPGGTGMDIFGRRFPKRTFDVGIAEQHAVTMAGGMACEGLKPFCAIYSTFLQRGYDQVLHDVAIQNLPVRFMLDRAGLVGNDGPTHHGCYDLAYLGCVPNLTIMSPSDEIELKNMVATCAAFDDGPTVLRYPRGTGYGAEKLQSLFGYDLENDEVPAKGEILPIGKGRIVRRPGGMKLNGSANSRGKERKDRVAILSFGTRLHEALVAANEVEESDPTLGVTVADARFMKPLDVDLVRELADDHSAIVIVEEGSIGGFGDHVLHFLALDGLLDDGKLKVRPMVIPDRYIEAGTQHEQYEMCGLNAEHIKGTVLRLSERKVAPVLQEQEA
uniref:1-deoxy-D-xylulose-5-phosphate synthase n=1 Tax=Odontella aurita TaxID=265563 RepID=A0A7S4K4C9_9STRA|mmetsp:Transcript_60618/g.179740  ORF Transcript_60618/g.179740 Transcript_60618/m.179740 type:complete len:740 (+) Transcript_60618:801-3020(+)|eukprot:CAMPEP_0113571538 /NCGR_PEP_ID=MMETSP0015_2-20120614/25608_1 /TAXON_ID=2838 /ORGANISM="Odontella" /LENGTH=739 /DNA_ID=CAMNT_0000474497 /DNA_START=534 /DNA_END=2753 /DNA_ORIENTATION=+ /assembly_acc=CAM_ASM_000160